MQRKPQLSFIIPAKNEAGNIPELYHELTLALKKIKKPYEIIFVDDGSTDSTRKVAKELGARVFKRNHSERSVQRNFGAKKAKGKYLFFLDADMELKSGLLENCLRQIGKNNTKALIVPEETAGDTLLSKVRRFERDMYSKDSSIEVARFFEKNVFFEFGGYDEHLTGAEDYDLPKRVGEKYKIGWARRGLIHHEEKLTLMKLLYKKYYYASKSVDYADKHPDLIAKQGTIIFRKAYLKSWHEFLRHPVLGALLIILRILVLIAAVAGYIRSAGIKKFLKTLTIMLKNVYK